MICLSSTSTGAVIAKAATCTLLAVEAGSGLGHVYPKGNCHLRERDTHTHNTEAQGLKAQNSHMIFTTFCWSKRVIRQAQNQGVAK